MEGNNTICLTIGQIEEHASYPNGCFTLLFIILESENLGKFYLKMLAPF